MATARLVERANPTNITARTAVKANSDRHEGMVRQVEPAPDDLGCGNADQR